MRSAHNARMHQSRELHWFTEIYADKAQFELGSQAAIADAEQKIFVGYEQNVPISLKESSVTSKSRDRITSKEGKEKRRSSLALMGQLDEELLKVNSQGPGRAWSVLEKEYMATTPEGGEEEDEEEYVVSQEESFKSKRSCAGEQQEESRTSAKPKPRSSSAESAEVTLK